MKYLTLLALPVIVAAVVFPRGYAQGTYPVFLVKDIHPSDDSSPGHLTYLDSTLFFRANDGTHGSELWALRNVALDDAVYLPTVLKNR